MPISISKNRKYIEILLALECILSMQPFMLWETYNYYRFFDIAKMVIELLILAIFALGLKSKIKKTYLACSISFAGIYIYYCFDSYYGLSSIGLGTIMKLFMIVVFLMLPNESKKNVFEYFLKFFAISLIPAMIFFLLNALGFNLPSEVIESTQEIKINSSQQYRHYFGCVFRENIYNITRIKQLCGIYDEPGLAGTTAALLLVANKFNFQKNKMNWVLVIGGIMTMSLAFFMICAIYYVAFLFFTKDKKKLYTILGVGVATTVLLMVLNNNDIFQRNVLARLSIDMLFNNNRTSEAFDALFGAFINSNNIWFGYGNGNPIFNTVDASSYKVLLFNFGIIGFVLIVGWFAFWGYSKSRKNIDALILATVFILSIYQRPWIMYLYMVVILLGGIECLKINNNQYLAVGTNEKSRSSIQYTV